MSGLRLPGEAQIDRTRPIQFTFNARRYTGFAGDTLASALLANGTRLVARSFKLHRPRGVVSAGIEEPSALVTVGDGPYREVNVRVTEVALYEGLTARSQNCWPTVGFDLAGVLALFTRVLPAGFYHKTLRWPAFSWYEGWVRRLAGLGRLNGTTDPNRYATRFHHTDVLIVGAGPAGLAAARAAAAQLKDVVLIDGAETFGGSLLPGDDSVEGADARRWAGERQRELSAMPRVLLLPRTTALGHYDGNLVTAAERIDEVRGEAPGGATGPRQRLWKIRAARIVLATGAQERPLIFPNNDRPGIMLASAVRTYLARFAVSPGSCAVIFTNNDSAYETAFALRDRRIEVAAIVDVRHHPRAALLERARLAGVVVHAGCLVIDTRGRKSLRAVRIAACDAGGERLVPGTSRTLRCDLLCTSGGWDPVVHLYAQAGGKLRYDAWSAAFVPADEGLAGVECVGAANGQFDLRGCLESGHRSGAAAAAAAAGAGARDTARALRAPHSAPINVPAVAPSPAPPAVPSESPIQAIWRTPAWDGRDLRHCQWVDLAHDVTVCDVDLAATEGFGSVEHMKRYTSAGMAVDQGKTSNVNALAVLGQATGRAPGEVGTTTFRPPFHPVAIGALAGARVNELAQRFRRLPVEWHEEHGGVMEDHSGWLRPAYYLKSGETEDDAIEREVRAARAGVALFDSSSLGKIEVRGADAAEFLNRLYVNNVRTLKPGCLRYGLMLNDNGIIIDDGVLACLGAGRYLVNTSSAGALNIHFWMEEWLQCEWSSLRVYIAQQTAQWATLTLSGPRARDVLAQLGLPLDLSARAFAHMRICETAFEGAIVRVRRASFTGELSFELDVPADLGDALWRRLIDIGAVHGITPIGMEALDVLRVEKGFLEVGADTDGDTSPLDVGWGAVIAKKPEDFIGRRSLDRPAMRSAARLQLVGLLPVDPNVRIPVGTHAVDLAGNIDGHVTSSCVSPHLGRPVALARVRGGIQRKGQTVSLDIAGRRHSAALVDPAFYDPHGERLNV
jgi:sarcosine oxidase subunit alpha